MSSSSLTHDEAMDLICGCCARKGDYSRKRDRKRRNNKTKLGKLSPITDDILELIRTHHFPDYCPGGNCPRVVCWSCVVALRDVEKNGTAAKHKLPDRHRLQPVPRAEEDAGLGLLHVPLVLGGQAEGSAVHHLLQVGEEPAGPTSHQPSQ